jgi:hypothetical protein
LEKLIDFEPEIHYISQRTAEQKPDEKEYRQVAQHHWGMSNAAILKSFNATEFPESVDERTKRYGGVADTSTIQAAGGIRRSFVGLGLSVRARFAGLGFGSR